MQRCSCTLGSTLCQYCEPLTQEQQSTSDATKFFFLQQPKRFYIVGDIPISIPQPLAPGGASYTVEGGGTLEGPRALTALPGQILPAQHLSVSHPFGTHKWSVSTPHSLVANAIGMFRVWGFSCAADDPPYITAVFTQTPEPEQLETAASFQGQHLLFREEQKRDEEHLGFSFLLARGRSHAPTSSRSPVHRLEEGHQLWASPIMGADITEPVAQTEPGFMHSQPSVL